MKATNNLNMDLKEEIEILNNEICKLQIFKDDQDEILKDMRIKMEKELDETIEAKDKELKSSKDAEALATG